MSPSDVRVVFDLPELKQTLQVTYEIQGDYIARKRLKLLHVPWSMWAYFIAIVDKLCISFEQMYVMNNNSLIKKILRIMEHAWEELDVVDEITVHKWHTPINNSTVTYIKSRYHRDCLPAERPELHFLQKQEYITIHESVHIDNSAPSPASCVSDIISAGTRNKPLASTGTNTAERSPMDRLPASLHRTLTPTPVIQPIRSCDCC
jgi:hypothetical protein